VVATVGGVGDRPVTRFVETLCELTETATAFETTFGGPVMGKARILAALSLGVGAAGAGAAIMAAFRSDMWAARARLADRSRLVRTACGLVEVAEAGSGPPVLVVHGTGGGFDQGMMAGKGPFGTGYRVIAPSRFGYLRSPMPADASHAAQAEVLAALLDALQVPRAVVMAVSAGAQPATQLALRHPERVQALVLITPALHLPPPPGMPPESGPPGFVLDDVLASDFLVWVIAHLVPNLLVRVAGVPSSLVGQVTPEVRKELVDGFFPASARHPGLAHDIRTTTPVAPELPIEQLVMPVMLVGTADDPYKTGEVVRYSAGRLPTAKALILESGGHVLIGQQHRIRQEVQEFLGAHATHAKQVLR
jgi:2-hydroxy-6-oxonona-2,4-dienedioate hydrolase